MAGYQLADDDAALTSFGLCHDADHVRYVRPVRPDYVPLPRPEAPRVRRHDGTKAVTIVATIRYDNTTTNPSSVLCRRHAGPDKAGITRRTYSGLRTILIENADVSSRAAVDAQVAAKLAERIANETARKAANAALVEALRPSHLIERLVEKPVNRFATEVASDTTFGTGTVSVDYKSITPGQARWLASRLLKLADEAEAIK